MNVVMFYHSVISDWNHGNAHFLRGVASELQRRGHDVRIYEPEDNWSLQNLTREHGYEPVHQFHKSFPHLRSTLYREDRLDPDRVLHAADLVLVHEWNSHRLVADIGAHRRRNPRYTLLFHDTHHRCVSDAASMARYDLSYYDGALVFGRVMRDIYLAYGWVRDAWVWHEAADAQWFRPAGPRKKKTDLVWIGNWGDDEREEELREFLIEPVQRLGLTAEVYGVRYPESARRLLDWAGIAYRGWLPNFEVPQVFAEARLTIHVPRRPYTLQLPGIPTIRPFEALACGIPLLSAPWQDYEGLFRPGRDYLVVHDADEMVHGIESVLASPDEARSLAWHGLDSIRSRHTCAHRVDQLLRIHGAIRSRRPARETSHPSRRYQ
jgi:spore maturation protein CgeB